MSRKRKNPANAGFSSWSEWSDSNTRPPRPERLPIGIESPFYAASLLVFTTFFTIPVDSCSVPFVSILSITVDFCRAFLTCFGFVPRNWRL